MTYRVFYHIRVGRTWGGGTETVNAKDWQTAADRVRQKYRHANKVVITTVRDEQGKKHCPPAEFS